MFNTETRLHILGWLKEVEIIKQEYAKSKNAKKDPSIDDLIEFVKSPKPKQPAKPKQPEK